MQRIVRTILVGVLVFMMSFNPAAAWHHWGGGGYYGGGYCGNYYGYCRSYGPVYSSCYNGPSGYRGSYGYQRVVYSEPYCGGCGSCGSCGGDCGSCGGCDGCSSCDNCGSCGGVVIESSPHVYQETAPQAPAEMRTLPTPPATVNKPMETTPAPTLPTEPAPLPERPAEPLPPTPTQPTDNLFGETPETTPPAETPTETPANAGRATSRRQWPLWSDDDGTDHTSATETPAETPAEGGATEEPATDSLFGEPAATGTPESTPEKPAEGTTPPADDPLDMFGPTSDATPTEGTTPPAGDSTSTDKEHKDHTFLASRAVLSEPGGLASDELRNWVDNTGRYSCQGRLVSFLDGEVRLMKDNGRTTTVPLYRLSATDLAFLHRQASAQPRETFAQTGQADTADTADTLTAN